MFVELLLFESVFIAVWLCFPAICMSCMCCTILFMQAEVDKVLYEITAGELGKAPAAVADTLIAPSTAEAEAAPVDFDEMRERLASLKN